ncbi:MAG: 4-hydroxyphenylpyruvate dioxygenase [Wenzhouxiangella sp.]|nr:MAG: 4-hydroxyphenylpyruvate dioxygenase [Wenzhouxiangella sp.]
MSDHRPDPVGVQQFEFIEFAAPDPSPLHDLFSRLGFVAVARHRSHPITLYRQGGINFLINEMPDSFASAFAAAHGPACTGFALRVTDPEQVRAAALTQGADPVATEQGRLGLDLPSIRGIGGSALYLTGGIEDLEREFVFDPAVERTPRGAGLTFIDHLTHNVYNGNMSQWSSFYEKLFGFYEVKYFDIKGARTGLRSQAMTAPNGRISIPINESEDPKSQINEYLDQYRGEGVQHIALYTDDIYASIETLRASGIDFLDTPDTYFDAIEQRIPDHDEDLPRMRRNKILIDADRQQPDKQLLQIFTKTSIGPIFFEVIQRKGNKGFGEGNFQALFEAIERDQHERGVL